MIQNRFRNYIPSDRQYIDQDDGIDHMLDPIRNIRFIRQVCSMFGLHLVEVTLDRPFQVHQDWSLNADELLNRLTLIFKRKICLFITCHYL